MTTISGTGIATGHALAIGGSATIILGSLLPWVTARSFFGQMSGSGVEGDGLLTLVLGGLLLVGAIVQFNHNVWRNLLMVGAAVVFFIAALTVINTQPLMGGEAVEVSIGPGVYLVILGAILIAFGAELHSWQARQEPPAQ